MWYFAGPSGRAVYGPSPAEIVGSNPTGGMDVCPLWVVCVPKATARIMKYHTDGFLFDWVYMVSFCWECNIVWVFVKSFWSLVGQCFLEVLLFVTLTDLGRECVRITFISKSFCWLIMNFKCSYHILNFNCPSDSVWAFFICRSVNFCWACNSTNITLIFRQCFLKNRIMSNVYDCCEY